ncbi:hypothetical protein Pcinc_019068 [Petrolisthes cinctipes]|uniref:Uncharacterized protein n=1 Tax=Petrolisthes cinctipes TaxID=88211 RepID=A0AAE1FMF4_PETCI|nr:hypothetical protein Pcinc_019068 [Petrolisthes cinctipes]
MNIHQYFGQDINFSSGGESRFGRQESSSPQRGHRTSDSHQRSDALFWAARGKRAMEGGRHSRSVGDNLQQPWASVGQGQDVSQGQGSNEGVGAVMGSGGASPGTTFWVARGKKDLEYLPYYWGSNQGMWGASLPRSWAATPHYQQQEDNTPKQQDASLHQYLSRLGSGWESNQSLWGKRSNQGPFWVARGKRQENGPFWISRGKRPSLSPVEYPSTYPSLRAIRGRKSGDETFWIARGKKDSDSGGAPYWVSRGKKEGAGTDTAPFWIARGNKNEVTSPTAPYWVARGKKDVEESQEPPFWISRGKKDEVTTVTTPYWIARGKKERQGDTFWVARGKKEEAKHPFWIARGKRSDYETNTHHNEDDEDEEEDEEEWQELEEEAEELTDEERTKYILESSTRLAHDQNTTQSYTDDKQHEAWTENSSHDTPGKTMMTEQQKQERHPSFLNRLVALRD